MKQVLFILLLLVGTTWSYANEKKHISDFIEINFERLNAEKSVINYDLNQLISAIEDSISSLDQVIIPKDATEFERLLFAARRIQHNDSQLTAIKILNYLHEFGYYRSRGEELYLKLLMAHSLNYIGATRMSINKFEMVFPEILDYVEKNKYKRILLDSYAKFLLQYEEIDRAEIIFKEILTIDSQGKDTASLLSSYNNVAYISFLNGQFDTATYYFRKIQAKRNKKHNPVVHAFSFGNYGDLLLERGQPDSALFYLRKEIGLLKEIPSDKGLQITYFLMGKSFQEKEKLDSAKHYFELSLALCESKNKLKKGIEAAKELIRISLINFNYDQAKKYMNSYFHLNEKLNQFRSDQSLQNEEKIADYLEIITEAHRSKQTFNTLEADNKLLFSWVIGLSTLLVILLLMGWWLRKSRLKLRNANRELILKNKDLNESNQLISESNSRNEILLKELHHRVKNNLQIISSLFNLQLSAHDFDQSTQEIFQVAKDRIHSISLLHKKIYQSENISSLNFSDYLRDFSDQLLKTTEKNIIIDIQAVEVNLNIDSALPLGLIFNELFTNSIKHANAESGLEITITFSEEKGRKKFIYTDNGKGINTNSKRDESKSIGFTLINLLAEQIEAETKLKEANPPDYGFWFSIEGDFQ